MGEQHLDFLPLAPGGDPLVFLGQHPRHVARAFMDRAHHLASFGAGAALRLESASVAIELAGAVAIEPISVRPLMVDVPGPAEPLKPLARGTGVVVLVAIEAEAAAVERAIR